jgi:HPt (histidine-containing phosphotransfer) domain-containing protein
MPQENEENAGEEKSWLDLHPQLAQTFLRDLNSSREALNTVYARYGAYSDEDLRLYTINAHSLKTVLANMGEKDLSAIASGLERAGRGKDTAVFAGETPAFLEKLQIILQKLRQKEG